MEMINPMVYFREYKFLESMVLSIEYREEDDMIDFVVDYTNIVELLEYKSAPKNDSIRQKWHKDFDRDFRKLSFFQIKNIIRRKILAKHTPGFDHRRLSMKPGEGHKPTIMGIYITTNQIGYNARFHLGTFGIYSFDFRTCIADRILAKAYKIDKNGKEDWIYRDIETGQLINFWEPFSYPWLAEI